MSSSFLIHADPPLLEPEALVVPALVHPVDRRSGDRRGGLAAPLVDQRTGRCRGLGLVIGSPSFLRPTAPGRLKSPRRNLKRSVPPMPRSRLPLLPVIGLPVADALVHEATVLEAPALVGAAHRADQSADLHRAEVRAQVLACHARARGRRTDLPVG